MKEDIYSFCQYASENQDFCILFAGTSYCDDSYMVARRNYTHYVIEYVFEGEGCLEIEGQTYNIKAGDTYFLYKQKGHRYYCKNNNWKKIWVVIHGRLADALFATYLDNKPNVLYGFNIFENLHTIFEAAKDRTLPYEQLAHKTALMVHRILIAAKEFQETKTNNLESTIKAYIDDHLAEPLRLEELADRFHYSKNHIINVFRDKYGMTPYMYYEEKRMLSAKELLLNSSLSIAEISEKLGFENSSYFSNRFTKYYGVRPTIVRKKMHKDALGARYN